MSPTKIERERAAAFEKDRPRVVRYFEKAKVKAPKRIVDLVARRMDVIRREYPDGDYPAPSRKAKPGGEESIEDDALRILRASG